MTKRKKVPETVSGQILAIPRVVKRSTAFIACSMLARALLLELADQHNGSNNGRLHISYIYLKEKGFRSKHQIAKGRDELLERNLIIQTKQGGLPIRTGGKTTFAGASWFALTWLHISNFVGLDLRPSDYHPGKWATPCEVPEREQPQALRVALKKRLLQPAIRDTHDPCSGTVLNFLDPYSGSTEDAFIDRSDPYHGNNVIHHSIQKISVATSTSEVKPDNDM